MKKLTMPLLGVLIGTATFFSLWTAFTPKAEAATFRRGEEYMVLTMASDNTGRGRLQATLNQLGQEGWKVRTDVRWDVNCIILAR